MEGNYTEIQLQNMKGNETNTENVPSGPHKVEKKANNMLLILIEGITAASIIVVSWCELTKNTKICDIKEALDLLKIDFSVSCKYDEAEEIIKSIWMIGCACLVFNFTCLLLVLFLSFMQTERRRTVILAIYVYTSLIMAMSVPLLIYAKKLLDSKSSQQHMDYGTLKKAMLASLTDNFTSDVITSNDTMSDRWNKFFIKYDCCAVHQVISTTNDFDTTPWCTTSGSCQRTNSQIPKTCCKGVTEDDYSKAASSCHATVSCGAYKDSCFTRVKNFKLGKDTIQEYQIDMIVTCSFALAIMKIAAFLKVVQCLREEL